MDIVKVRRIYDLLGRFRIERVEHHKETRTGCGYQYRARVILNTNSKILEEVSVFLNSWSIPNFKVKNDLTIAGHENINSFISLLTPFEIQKNKVDIINKFIKHRSMQNKKLYDANDEAFYKEIRAISNIKKAYIITKSYFSPLDLLKKELAKFESNIRHSDKSLKEGTIDIALNKQHHINNNKFIKEYIRAIETLQTHYNETKLLIEEMHKFREENGKDYNK